MYLNLWTGLSNVYVRMWRKYIFLCLLCKKVQAWRTFLIILLWTKTLLVLQANDMYSHVKSSRNNIHEPSVTTWPYSCHPLNLQFSLQLRIFFFPHHKRQFLAFRVHLPGWVAITPSSLFLKAFLYFSFFSKFFRLRKNVSKTNFSGWSH